MENWVKVFSTVDVLRADIVKDTLISNNVNAVVLNKVDSAYNNFGLREVYVENENVNAAQRIIEQDLQFK